MRRFIFPAVVISLTLLFFWKLAFTDLILARGDTYYFFYPLWAARDQAFRAGELPLWTNNVFMGAPLLSDPQPGTLYPPNWLTMMLAPPDAIRISILLHVAWATAGAMLLARRVLRLDVLPALIAGAIFGLGGYLGSHVEQINQLQGLAWLPWALLVFALALDRPGRYTPLLAVIFALQVLSGHTQTVFITGVGLGLYGLVDTIQHRAQRAAPLLRRFLKFGVILIGAVLLAAILAIAQLYPTLELTGLSNRGGGFNPQQAMAFSWNPFLAGRGLLPGYDAQVFGEYVAYVGVVGLALALYGILAGDNRKWRWLILIVIGIFFAFGLYNPLYWTLAGLPGFNLFRVPARWLVLFAIGAAMLAGLGAQTLMQTRSRWRDLIVISGVIGMIAASTLLADRAANEVDGAAVPGILTWGLWGAALVLFIGFMRWRSSLVVKLLPVIVIGELFLASLTMPYNDLAAPEAYHDARMSIHQLQAYCDDKSLCDRVLSISGGFFDPGDKAAMTTRYANLTERANRHAFTAAKMKELVAPNLPLVWDVPSVDGAGGGIIPTSYYTQFTSLMLPEGLPRSIDGRLREFLALP
ncbi:MAG: YfhO family protein, partial [Anaerolineae bacterium]|nr:YfhO family protein [Anaerolineae bacterium]